MKATLICCSLLMAGAALAAPGQDRPQDYAWSMPIQSPAGAGVVQLTLPREVYLHASSASLADVRLFDADGKRLAYALGAPPAQSATQRTAIPVRIFPVTGAPATGDGLQGIDIRTADDGRLLSVSARAGTAAATAALQALILDLGRQTQDKRIAALRFTPPPRTDNYSAQVLLEVSDDLKQWDAIGTTTLNWLSNSDTQTLANDSIAFAPRAFRYARLSWQAGEPLAFAAITAQAVSETDIPPSRASVVLQGAPGKQANEWRYATPLAIPADSIALQLTQTNTVLPVTLGVYRQNSYVPRHRLHLRHQARPAQGAYFDPLLSTTFYRIGLDGKERISGDLAMPVTQTNEWVLQTSTEHPVPAANAPSLRLGWTPATVVFLASGKPPYQLAFGNSNAAAVAQPLAQVAPGFRADELLALKTASAGPLKPNGGVEAPAPVTKDGAPWRLAALWAALLLGVAVLGSFAWRLLSQMKAEHGSADKQEQEH